MSSSWNFPARASPSYESSDPIRAELGHFNFQAENELDFFFKEVGSYFILGPPGQRIGSAQNAHEGP